MAPSRQYLWKILRSRLTLNKCVVSAFIQRSWRFRNWTIPAKSMVITFLNLLRLSFLMVQHWYHINSIPVIDEMFSFSTKNKICYTNTTCFFKKKSTHNVSCVCISKQVRWPPSHIFGSNSKLAWRKSVQGDAKVIRNSSEKTKLCFCSQSQFPCVWLEVAGLLQRWVSLYSTGGVPGRGFHNNRKRRS